MIIPSIVLDIMKWKAKMAFDKQPTLEGELIILRPISEDDFDDLFNAASDPKIWEQHPAWDRYKKEIFEQFFEDALETESAFVILDSASNKIIGSSRYYGYNQEEDEIEIGWSFLSRAYWGGRYNQETKKLLLAHAFKFVKKVVFLVGPENYRSCKAMEKIGGKTVGIRKNALGVESLIYQITDSQFVQSQSSNSNKISK